MTSRFQSQPYLRNDQYAGSANLSRRALLHTRYRTHAQPWQAWLFDQLALEPGSSILECGAGAGWLWHENLQKLPAGCRVTLSDLADGMVAELQTRLGDLPQFHVEQADIQQLPFADDRFDVVIANHMLYHVADIERALGAVRRVLQPNGRFFCATNGLAHLTELATQAQSAPSTFISQFRQMQPTFTLENGANLLSSYFDDVSLLLYDDTLRVTEAQPVIDYLLSSSEARAAADESWLQQTRATVEHRIEEHGAFTITKATGLFVAKNTP